MRIVFRNRVALAALTLMAGACVENLDPTPSLTSPSAGARVPMGEGSVRAAGNPPAGAFRTTPAANEDVITISLGEEVLVNGARFVAADSGDELKVEVEWGDGERAAIGCGPCRLSHVFRRPGTYSLTATVHNRRLADRGEVSQVFLVVVRNQAPEPAAPLFCHSINAVLGNFTAAAACPSGAMQFCDSVPIVATSSDQALLACTTCSGGPCLPILGSNTVGDAWVGLMGPPLANTVFQYTVDPLPNYGPKTPGTISNGAGSFGRWAP
jgi:hypothetical protein